MTLKLNFIIIGKGNDYSSEVLALSLKALQGMRAARGGSSADYNEFVYADKGQLCWRLY